MTIEIFGRASSRARRPLWVARTLALDFVSIVPAAGETVTADFRAINPNGKIPALRDGDFVLFESMAITMYLAKTYGGEGAEPLYPAGPQTEAMLWQWGFWAVTEVEPLSGICLVERLVRQPAERDDAKADAAELALAKPLGVLERELAQRDWLVSGHFTVADIMVAAVLALAKVALVDFSGFPKVSAWLDRCLAREPRA